MTSRFVVDRFEGELAVVLGEDGRVLDVPRSVLPDRVREGDVILARERTPSAQGPALEWWIDGEATAAARDECTHLLDRLRTRDTSGDLDL